MKIVVTSAGMLRKVLEWLRLCPVAFTSYTLTVVKPQPVVDAGYLLVHGAINVTQASGSAEGTTVTAGSCTIDAPDKLRLALQKVGERAVTVESFADCVKVSWIDETYADAPEESIVTLDGGTV